MFITLVVFKTLKDSLWNSVTNLGFSFFKFARNLLLASNILDVGNFL